MHSTFDTQQGDKASVHQSNVSYSRVHHVPALLCLPLLSNSLCGLKAVTQLWYTVIVCLNSLSVWAGVSHSGLYTFVITQVWILAAQFEIRQLSMDAARKILGRSLGMCPKDRTYKAYIDVRSATCC